MIDPDEVRRAHPLRSKETIGEPNDDLTEMGERLINAFEADPRYGPEMRLIVFIDDMAERRGGAATHGYNDDTEMCQNIYRHAQGTLRYYGIKLEIT
jgi:hypothetical protein